MSIFLVLMHNQIFVSFASTNSNQVSLYGLVGVTYNKG